MRRKKDQEIMGYFSARIYPSTKKKAFKIKKDHELTWDEFFLEAVKLFDSSK